MSGEFEVSSLQIGESDSKVFLFAGNDEPELSIPDAIPNTWFFKNDGAVFRLNEDSQWIEKFVFGSEFQEVSTSIFATFTSSVFQPRLTLSTPDLPEGKYRISCNYSWSQYDYTKSFKASLKINDDGDNRIHMQSGADGRLYASRTMYKQLSGANEIKLEFAIATGGSPLIIRISLIEFFRVI